MYFILMGEWNPPEWFIHTKEKTFNPSKVKHVLKPVESHVFQGFSEGLILENRLQNLNGVTDFSQKNF